MTADLTPGFLVLHSHRLENLRDVLVQWLQAYPLAPLEDEIVLVQSNGMAQWLKAALAADEQPADPDSTPPGLGICAAVKMQFPARFFWQAYRAVLGPEAVPKSSPFDKERLRWRILRLLPGLLGRHEFEPLRQYLADDPDGRKAWQLAAQLADLFDQYQVYRADWLGDWSQQRDILRQAPESGREPLPLPERERWQPQLWRALEADILADSAAGDSTGHRAALQARFAERLRSAPRRPAGLPRRVIVWGFSTLPGHVLEGLAELGRHVQVILAVVNPCQYYWADLVQPRQRLRHARKASLPALLSEQELSRHANPLLLAWGQQGRDYLKRLELYDDPDSYRARFQALGQRIDLFDQAAPADAPDQGSLLAQLQQAVLDLEPVPAPEARRQVAADDRSLRFQVAHSRLREVEALHDHLLAAFDAARAEGRPLRPQDVVVMVPDIRQYAPLVQAVFDRDDETRLPFAILDRPQRGEQPLLTALEWLLGLPEARCTSAELWDLLDVPALAARFAITADELPRLRRWFEAAGARWGLDAHHRTHWQMPEGMTQNTWRFALDRLLLGYAVGDDSSRDQVFAGTLPQGDFSPLEAAALGPMSQVLAALAEWAERLRAPRPVVAWRDELQALLAAFLLPSDDNEAWLLEQLQQALLAWADEAREAAAADACIALAVVREGWLSRLDEASMSQRFLSGAIHVATLMPMRAIPFRLVCILGLNDGDFPRQRLPVDFDLMSLKGQQRAGDRSRREDDRYLFLEALLSAREQLLLSWVGRSARSNQPLPPSLLVAQLQDYLRDGWQGDPAAGTDDLLAMLTTEHALQPFSERYFLASADAGQGRRLQTYAGPWRAARELQAPPRQVALPAPTELPALTLATLAQWLRDPARVFYRDRLGVSMRAVIAAVPEHEPFAVDPLAHHQAVEALLSALRQEDSGEAMTRVVNERAGRGEWPLAGFADPPRRKLGEVADLIWQAAADWREAGEEAPRLLSWQGEVSGCRLQLEHAVTDIRRDPDGRCRLWQFTASSLHKSGKMARWHPLLLPWLQHVLLAVCGQAMPTRVVSPSGTVDWPPLSVAEAGVWWQQLLAYWLQGQSRALPLEAKTAFAWAVEAMKPEADEKALEAAATCYDGSSFGAGQAPAESAPLGWVWPDFAALAASGEFVELSRTLFLPLVQTTLGRPGDTP